MIAPLIIASMALSPVTPPQDGELSPLTAGQWMKCEVALGATFPPAPPAAALHAAAPAEDEPPPESRMCITGIEPGCTLEAPSALPPWHRDGSPPPVVVPRAALAAATYVVNELSWGETDGERPGHRRLPDEPPR
jgi:hypothetical protein